MSMSMQSQSTTQGMELWSDFCPEVQALCILLHIASKLIGLAQRVQNNDHLSEKHKFSSPSTQFC